jgi:predicted DsbA family dithiol-disulfide isomerase
MKESHSKSRQQEEAASGSSPAGRTLLLIAVIVAFATGAFGGWLVAKERPAREKALSDATYLVGVGDSPSAGPDTALVTIVEFNDMRCKRCDRVDHILRQAVDLYPGEVRVIWKNAFTDADSEESLLAAQAGVAAGYAGKFWEMRDKIAAAEGKIDIERLAGFARETGLDGKKFAEELSRGVYARRARVDTLTAERMVIKKIPTVFVNGKVLLGEVTLEKVRKAVEQQMPEAKALLAAGASPTQIYWEIVKKGGSALEAPPKPAPPPIQPGASTQNAPPAGAPPVADAPASLPGK